MIAASIQSHLYHFFRCESSKVVVPPRVESILLREDVVEARQRNAIQANERVQLLVEFLSADIQKRDAASTPHRTRVRKVQSVRHLHRAHRTRGRRRELERHVRASRADALLHHAIDLSTAQVARETGAAHVRTERCVPHVLGVHTRHDVAPRRSEAKTFELGTVHGYVGCLQKVCGLSGFYDANGVSLNDVDSVVIICFSSNDASFVVESARGFQSHGGGGGEADDPQHAERDVVFVI